MKSIICQKMLAIGLLSVASGAFAQSAERPDVHVGDRWSWQHTNKLANEMDSTRIEDVVEVNEQEIKTRVRIKGQTGNGIAVYSREWNPVDAVSARYSPFLKEYAFPLQAGKKWEGDADKMVFSSGKHGKFHSKGSVGALEKVTVPAGTFDVYRVTVELDAMATDEDANIGHTVETYWYAPAVKRYVKMENTFSRDGRVRSSDGYELLEFNLR